MTKFAILAAAAAALLSQAATAQSSVLVIGQLPAQRAVKTIAPLPLEKRIELAAERACQAPSLRELKGKIMYRNCLAQVREEVRAQVAGRPGVNLSLATR